METVSPHLSRLYEQYFTTESAKDCERVSAAMESVNAIIALGGVKLGRVIDVGAGDGVVSFEIDRRKIASSIVAAEISASGIEKMLDRSFSGSFQVRQVDGYMLPFENAEFDTAVCAHVIEHVEHERVFLREIARVAKQLFLIAPLEGGLRGRVDRRMGHINYYTPMTLRNLVETSGFVVTAVHIFPASAERERIISGDFKGSIKNLLRKCVTRVTKSYAPHIMTHVMAIHATPGRQ
jgi:SAM-dependent methyltransferase